MEKILKQICSNCGQVNKYKEGEYTSREETLCKTCGHSLSVCSGFVEMLE